MQTAHPALMDKALADWLEQSCGVKLVSRTAATTHVRTMVAQAIRSKPNLGTATTRTLELLKPASDSEIMDALLSLESATAKPKSETSDAADEFKLDRYLAKLREFPADIVLHMLATWDDRPPPQGLFFPRTAELRPLLMQASSWRRQLLPALQSCEPHESEIVVGKTPEELEADKQEVRRKYAETMRALGGRPRRDLLPDNYVDAGDELPATSESEPAGLISQHVAQLREQDREIAAEQCAEALRT